MVQKIFIQNKDIVTRKILDETILVPIRGNIAEMEKIFSLNSVGEYIWQNLDGRKSLSIILSEMVDVFEVDEKVLEADALAFISDLQRENLIVEG